MLGLFAKIPFFDLTTNEGQPNLALFQLMFYFFKKAL